MPTPHYKRVRDFMQKAGQETPNSVTIPNKEIRKLRAALILEEALETIEALGVDVFVSIDDPSIDIQSVTTNDKFEFIPDDDEWVDLEGVVDGCADISVVTIGTLIAFGIDDEPVLEEVDNANLRKFEEGSYRRKDGKWMKPPGWTPPNISQAITSPNL